MAYTANGFHVVLHYNSSFPNMSISIYLIENSKLDIIHRFADDEITRPGPVTGMESASVPVQPSVSLTNNAQRIRLRRPPNVRLGPSANFTSTIVKHFL
jgi:hypothetical protein